MKHLPFVALLALPLGGCGVDVGASLAGLAISNVAGAGMQAAVRAVTPSDTPAAAAHPSPAPANPAPANPAPANPAPAVATPTAGAPFDASTIPLVSDDARRRLGAYAARPPYKAVAISPSGAWAAADTLLSEAEARRVVLERCNFDDSSKRCVLYAVGDRVVYDR